MATVVKRINWIDELKGFALLIICLGHVAGMVYTPPNIKYIADIFTIIAVPLFFVLSGILYTHRTTATKEYITKKTKSLLVPYFLLSILFSILDPYIFNSTYLINELHYPRLTLPESWSIDINIQASIEWFIGDLCCTLLGISSRATLPLWFVFVLYFASIIYQVTSHLFRSKRVMTFLAFCAFSLAMTLDSLNIGGYLKTGPILMAFVYYWFGTIVSSRLHIIKKKNSGTLIFLSIPLIVLYMITSPKLLTIVGFVNGHFAYEQLFSYLLISILGLCGLVFLFSGISKIQFMGLKAIKGILRNISRNSLIILATHYYFLCVFSLYVKLYIPQEWHFMSAIIFVIMGCVASIVLFRTQLYMLIGGKKAKQTITTCLSIK